MAEPRVIFDGVWKKFRRGERHDSLRDLIPATARKLFGRKRDEELEEQEFWALKDVSFEVKPGEALGIIGPNGAGKSTTLKLLTRILRPTKGHCALRGRVGALIEVAAGFHPDLTGRENIFLQGAIMGMPREQIASRFEEIVEFAGVSSFVDTQVKRYSSGMSARLGFSIAAHLQPDVLLVDEVLAVGDLAYQRRAFARVSTVVKQNVAVVVVSHQLEQVAALCSKALLLQGGQALSQGATPDVIANYLRGSIQTSQGPTDRVTFTRCAIEPGNQVSSGQSVVVRVLGRCSPMWSQDRQPAGVRLRSGTTGELLFATGLDRHGVRLDVGDFTFGMSLQMNVGPGMYVVEPFAWDADRNCELTAGPPAELRVIGAPENLGSVFLCPRIVK